MKSRLISAGIAVCVCAGISPLLAGEPDNDPTATIIYANNQSVIANSDGRVFDLVGLQPNETVDVRVQFSTDKAGHMLQIEPRDGGCVSSPAGAVFVADDGTISFRFQGGQSPGRYQVSLHDGAEEVGLEFWVLDLANPQNNPRVLFPANPNI